MRILVRNTVSCIGTLLLLTACASDGGAPPASELRHRCPPGQTMICYSRSGTNMELPPEERSYDHCRCRATDNLGEY